jgi:hypothetical protein
MIWPPCWLAFSVAQIANNVRDEIHMELNNARSISLRTVRMALRDRADPV